MHITRRFLGFLVLTVLLAFAFGQDAQGDAQAADALFVTTAAQGDLFEIMSSELALERAESQEVQDFAQQMIDAHTATTEQLTPIAEALGVAPPSEPNAMQQLMIAHLGTLEGAAFDTTYLEHQVLAHEAAVASYVTASDLVQDQALQDFVAQNLPAIQEHLQMAQQMMAQGTMTGGGN